MTRSPIIFDRQRFAALADYVYVQHAGPICGSRLSFLMFNIDMAAYARLGSPVTGATYTKGREHPEVRELGDGWFERYCLSRQPWWARAAGRLIAWCAAGSAARRSLGER